MHPDKNKLSEDLLKYNQADDNSLSYNDIVQNLITGTYVIYLPTQNNGKVDNKWKTLKEGSELKLKSVFDMDGLNPNYAMELRNEG